MSAGRATGVNPVLGNPERSRVDLRLAPAALAVWAVTLAGAARDWIPVAVLAVLLLGAGWVVWLKARSRRWINGVLAAVVMAAAAATGVAVRLHQLEEHPLRDTAERGGRVTVRVVLDEAPSPLQGASFGARRAQDRALVRAELRTADVDGERFRAGGEVLMLVPSQHWCQLIAGQEVTATGKAVAPQAGDFLVATIQVYRPPSAVGAAPEWQQRAEQLRDGLRRTSAAVLGPVAAGLLPGLVVGDTGGLPPEVVREFTTAGLTHLTAVSGANLAIVCGAVLLLLHVLGAGPWLSALGAGAALVGFVVLAGPEPSVLRAAVMGVITLFALLLGRDRSALPALAASVIGLLLLSPELATNVGFALSVAATGGLVLLAPVWSAALRSRGVPIGLAEALAVPAAAHVVTAPLIAAVSGEVSTIAVVANLLAGPVIAPATVLGVLATVTAPLAGWMAQACVWLSAPELEWVLAVAHHAAAVPGGTVEWPSGSFGGLLLAVLTVIVLVFLRRRRFRWSLPVIVLLAVVVLVPVRESVSGWPVRDWSMVACDVGQGDGLVLATGTPHEAVVVDTGPDPPVMEECLSRLGIRRVPLVVLTHMHADHVSGLPAVLADQRVAMVAIGGLREPAWAWTDIRAEAESHHVPVVPLASGQQMRWSALALDVVGPGGELARTTSADDANDASIVVKATTPAGRILLTGDVELAGQSQLLASGVDLRADVIKIPHHGSRYTTPRFLDAVQAKLALISVGQGNSYGHPSPLVLGALSRTRTTVARTDQDGDIAVYAGPQGPRIQKRGDPIRADEN